MAGRRRTGFTKIIAHKGWSTIVHGQIASMDIAENVTAVGDVAGAVVAASTILRTRGIVFAQLDSTAVDERVTIAVGVIIAGERAVTAGVASLPGPLNQGADDWIWHGYLTVSSGAEAAINDNSLFDRLEIDSKAMRKVKEDETFVFMAQIADSLDQGGSVDLMYATRVLFGD